MPKILLIRLSSIGDIVLTTPVIRCLKTQTACTLHFLSKKSFESTLKHNIYIDKLWLINEKIGEVMPELKAEKFDWVIDLHNNFRTAQLKWLLRVPSKSFNKLNIYKWLMVNLKVDFLPKIHIVDRYLETVAHLGVKNDGKGLDYFVTEEDELWAQQFLATKEVEPLSYVAIVLGATYFTKRIPLEKIAEICHHSKTPVLLLGGKAEAAEGEKLELLQKKLVTNVAGKCTLNQSAALLKYAKKVVTSDTGLMHIAAALQKETLVLWGNTVPEFGMYPYYGNQTDKHQSLEVKELNCRPCSKLGYDACPKGHFKCMQLINNLDIIYFINK